MIIPYLASVEWYADFLSVMLNINDDVPTPYRTLNRCLIAAANGSQTLSVPIVGGAKSLQRLPFESIVVSEHGNWRHIHWGAIFSAYGKAPFFEHYAHLFEPLFLNRHHSLQELNEELHNRIVEILKLGELKNFISQNKLIINKSTHKLTYYQLRSEKFGFIPNLSIIDLIFNMGPEAILVLLAHVNNRLQQKQTGSYDK